MLDLGTQKPQGKTFAINVAMRNPQGKVVGYKYLETDDATELASFYDLHAGTPRKKNKKVEVKQS